MVVTIENGNRKGVSTGRTNKIIQRDGSEIRPNIVTNLMRRSPYVTDQPSDSPKSKSWNLFLLG